MGATVIPFRRRDRVPSLLRSETPQPAPDRESGVCLTADNDEADTEEFPTRPDWELASERLHMTGSRVSDEAISERAYRLYVDKAPCPEARCLLSRGHAGKHQRVGRGRVR